MMWEPKLIFGTRCSECADDISVLNKTSGYGTNLEGPWDDVMKVSTAQGLKSFC
jgi:uncharacterized protein YqgV (UPF0045/DUF77 family)